MVGRRAVAAKPAAIETKPIACVEALLGESASSDDATPCEAIAAPCFRRPTLRDAAAIHRLVSESGVLDENSLYCYLLICRDFSDTSLIACQGDRLLGFVNAYRPPPRSDMVFVWQIGVAANARGQGLGLRLLESLVALPGCQDVRYLGATVTPSNVASRRLFRSFAERQGVPCSEREEFPTELFRTDATKEPEDLFLIGPLTNSLEEK